MKRLGGWSINCINEDTHPKYSKQGYVKVHLNVELKDLQMFKNIYDRCNRVVTQFLFLELGS